MRSYRIPNKSRGVRRGGGVSVSLDVSVPPPPEDRRAVNNKKDVVLVVDGFVKLPLRTYSTAAVQFFCTVVPEKKYDWW